MSNSAPELTEASSEANPSEGNLVRCCRAPSNSAACRLPGGTVDQFDLNISLKDGCLDESVNYCLKSSRPDWTLLLASMSRGFRPYLLLILLSAALYLPGIAAIPPTDRDEARYIQATKQMLETDNYVDIFFQHNRREKKPVGVHWLQAMVAKGFGASKAPIWTYRIPSVVGATAAVLLTFFFGATLLGPQTALLGATILASSLVLVAEAHLAKTDAPLLATVVATTGFLLLAYLRGALAIFAALFFWVALGVGTLIKGPVLPGLVGMTSLGLIVARRGVRWLRALRPILGIPIYLLVLLPWFAAIERSSGGTFVKNSFSGDILPKLVGVHESHGGFPGYYTLLLLVTFWPWSLYAVRTIKAIWPEAKESFGRRRPCAIVGLLCWLVPSWLVLELVPTKLPHYSLPLYPSLALLTAYAIFQTRLTIATSPRAGRWLVKVWGVFAVALASIMVIAPFMFAPHLLPLGAALTCIILALCYYGLRSNQQHPLDAAPCLLAGMLALSVFFFGWLFPGLEDFWVSQKLATAIAANDSQAGNKNGPPVSLAGYQEPSSVVLLGTATLLGDGADAARFLRENMDGIAVVEKRQKTLFLSSLGDCSGSLELVGEVSGFNYSKGKRVTLELFRLDHSCSIHGEDIVAS